MTEDFRVSVRKPKPAEYMRIREESGFGRVTLEQSEISLAQSLFSVSVHHLDQLVGFGRILGDGVLFFYISDVMVSSKMKGKGIGGLIMENLIRYLETSTNPLSTISVLSAPNHEDFYSKYGFEICPNEYFGTGLSYNKFIKIES